MLEVMRGKWRGFARAKPGRRFQNRYDRLHSESGLGHKLLVIGAGVILILAGVVLLVVPGPGIIVAAIGGMMLAEESKTAARALDWLETRLRAIFARVMH